MSRRTIIIGMALLAAAAVVADAACGGGGGSNAACTTDAECGTGNTCQQGVCKPQTAQKFCQKAEDCAAGTECVGGQCKPKYGSCFADTDCQQGMRCNITKNVCVFSEMTDGGPIDVGVPDTGAAELNGTECASDFQCSAPTPSCINGFCKSCKQTGCQSQMQCDLVSGACVPRSGDGGIPDVASSDSGHDDSGTVRDTGTPDTGTPDSGGADTGTVDAGAGCSQTGCDCGQYCDQGTDSCVTGCVSQGDCCAGTSCVSGACITPQCASDADCTVAPNNRCLKPDGTCVECTADYHCPGSTCDKTTYTCAPKQPGDIGADCLKDADCQMGDTCIAEKDTSGKDTGFVGGYCTQDCTSSGFCDSFSADCVAVSSSLSRCLLDCYMASDCRTGYVCVSAGTVSVCYPRCDNPGMSCAKGYVCQAGTGECDGTQDVTDPCGGTYNACKTGLVCAGYTGEQYHCYKECDPAASSGPFCSTGEVCENLQTTGICDYGGSVALNGDCTSAECEKGLICAGSQTSGYKCYKGCDKKDGSPGCSGSKTCTLLSGETRLGICK